MGSYKRPSVFDPLDLQIIDLVYEAAWAGFIARDPYRDTRKDEDRQELLRKKVFAVATPGEVEFDALLDKVLASIPGTWTTARSGAPLPRSSPSVGNALDADEMGK